MTAETSKNLFRRDLLIWLIFSIALFATNSSILPTDHLTRISAYDTWIYLQIADAAPGVPPAGSDLVYHGAMRFLFPYILGMLAKLFGMTSWSMFRLASHILVSLTIAVFWSITGQLSKSFYLRLVAAAALCFQVYLFRLQLAFSGFVNDTLNNLKAAAIFLFSRDLAYGNQQTNGLFCITHVRGIPFCGMLSAF